MIRYHLVDLLVCVLNEKSEDDIIDTMDGIGRHVLAKEANLWDVCLAHLAWLLSHDYGARSSGLRKNRTYR